MKVETLFTFNYLTLRLVLSLNNPQNSEMIFCENMKLKVENHPNYHRLHSK